MHAVVSIIEDIQVSCTKYGFNQRKLSVHCTHGFSVRSMRLLQGLTQVSVSNLYTWDRSLLPIALLSI